MDVLPNEMLYEILTYCNPEDYSCVCTLWYEIAKHERRKDYVEKQAAISGETREFINSCYEDYLNNWM